MRSKNECKGCHKDLSQDEVKRGACGLCGETISKTKRPSAPECDVCHTRERMYNHTRCILHVPENMKSYSWLMREYVETHPGAKVNDARAHADAIKYPKRNVQNAKP